LILGKKTLTEGVSWRNTSLWWRKNRF